MNRTTLALCFVGLLVLSGCTGQTNNTPPAQNNNTDNNGSTVTTSWCQEHGHGEQVTDGCVARPTPYDSQVRTWIQENNPSNPSNITNYREPCSGNKVIACYSD